jgi:hypothetical protein
MHAQGRVPDTAVQAAQERPAAWVEAVIDLYGCDLDRLRDPDIWRGFIANLAAVVDMKAHGDMRLEMKANGPFGWSAVQPIETGLIIGQGDEPGLRCFWNVFSCCQLDPAAAATVAAAYFGGAPMLQMPRRGASPPTAEAPR